MTTLGGLVANWPALIAIATFCTVILVIALDWLHLTVAAFLGAILLMATGVLSAQETSQSIDEGYDTIALFFGGMVVARGLIPTRIFDLLGALTVRLVRGDGRRLLIGIILLATPICALLPNATVVILLAPLLVRVCRLMRIDFVPPVILLVFVANSAGLLTLVGDPATFIIGRAIKIGFVDYLVMLGLGGALAIAALACLLPLSFRSVWRARAGDTLQLDMPRIERPVVLVVCLAVFALMIAMFIVGEYLAVPISPPAAALFGAALILLVINETGIDSVANVLRDIDWETLLFFICIFVLVGALDRTGVLAAVGSGMAAAFGHDIATAALIMLFVMGLLSSIIPNIPLVVAMVPLVKQYLVSAGLASASAVEAGYAQLPAEVLPLFFAMMYGATLGGNGTMLGASSNIVAAGICRRNGRPFKFFEFLSYGAPVVLVQLLASAAYLRFRFG